MLRYGLPLLVFGVILYFLFGGLSRDPRLVPSPLVGKPAPAFDLPQLRTPETRSSQADLVGTPTLVNVWASWCVACRDEHEVLLRLARARRVRVLGLNYKDERDKALDWLSRLGDPYESIIVDADGRAAIDWGVYGVPESFLVDAKGIIRYKHVGPLTWALVEDELFPLLKKSPGRP
jgi:cytochrome c biogenesis protein CcmG, thiol:disulfide interchange protein DsbE